MNHQTRPNIIFLFSDQQRYDTVSCYGEKLGSDFNLTPNLDRLAETGIRFDQHMTCQPVCGPARAAIQTGQYPNSIGCHINDTRLPQHIPTIANHLNRAGYETAYVGKWHLASHRSFGPSIPETLNYKTTPIPPELRGGYENFWVASDVLEFTSNGYEGYMWDQNMQKRSFNNYRADATTDFALEYLTQPKDKPFFLFISYIEPHHQNDRNETQGPPGSKEKYEHFTVPGDLEGLEGDWQKELPDYLGCCANLDENVGRIVTYLKEHDLIDNTVLLYTSDHGSHFKTRNHEYKRSCHDSSLHVPFIASGPGFTGGKVVSDLTSLIDIAPTILAAAGLDRQGNMPGIPMQSWADTPGDQNRTEVFIQISESCVGRAIRTPRFTYFVEQPLSDDDKRLSHYYMAQNQWDIAALAQPHSDVYQESLLYDLEKDPYQHRNVILDPAYSDVRAELKETLLKYIREIDRNDPIIISANC